jgi:Concanavalin A-like lectin/glucanases superfamily
MPITFTATRSPGDDINVPLTINFVVGGSATFPTDYTVSGADTFNAAAGMLTIPAAQMSASLLVTPVADLTIESNETIVLTPQPQPGVWVTGTLNWTGTIIDDDNSDPYAASVLLLLKFVGADNSTNILDSSPSPKIVDVFGNTQILSNRGIFDGNGDYLRIQKSQLDMSAVTDYTIEAIVRVGSATAQLIAATYNFPNQAGHLICQPDYFGTDQLQYAAPTITVGADVHLALVRDGGIFRVYKQGSLVASVSGINFLQGGAFYIGGSPGDPNIGARWLNGEMAGFRISNVARYTGSSFSPPSVF